LNVNAINIKIIKFCVQGKLNIVTLGLVGYCTVIASLVAVFFLAPMMQFGGGPFGMGAPPEIPDDVLDDLNAEIQALESVITFKATFPNFREIVKESYGVEYIIQARNANTGNVLSLMINYHPMGPPGSTDKFQNNSHMECIPGEGIMGPDQMMMMQNMFRGGEDLFIHETIKNTDCLSDDWEPVLVTQK
jgi:hypothetical protein